MSNIITESKTLSQPNDFAADVLDQLQRNGVKFHGCKPSYLEFHPNGNIKVVFQGDRNDAKVKGRWTGGVTIHKQDGLDNAFVRGDSNAFTQVVMGCLDDINSRIA